MTVVSSSLGQPAILNYTELQSLIARRMKRTDLSAYIPGYIRIAEARIASNIRARELETVYTVSTTTSSNSIALPQDYGTLKNVQILGAINTPLTLLPDDKLLEYSSINDIGIPNFYLIQGNSLILCPTPNSEYSVQIVYYQRLPSLTDQTATNWLLVKAPDIYLYGSLVEACIDTQDFELLQLYEPRYKEAVEKLWETFTIESFSGSPLRAVSSYVV